MIRFDNSYSRLPPHFFARVHPVPVPQARLIALNRPLAARMGLDADWLASDAGVAMLAGNSVPEGAAPLAQAYAGHQFGNFVPQLGDGRALLLGEVIAPDGARFDIQLKGSGPTPFSRRGDGRAWLGPVLREYLMSEFMAAVGVPTTRALAAVTTGETIWRETALPGAILTRVASSHIRIGTFQYFAVRGDTEALAALTDHVIARHYPQADGPLALLQAVVAAQAATVAQWMALGFVHGVMNTDNMAVSGETIDYGPAAFINGFRPDAVFSSIDRTGRYAWDEQPQIAVWNLAQFASALVPLIGMSEAAIESATRTVHSFADLFETQWLRRFGDKLGIAATAEDRPLIERLLRMMAAERADFTRVFHGLSNGLAGDEFTDREAFDAWATDWQARGPDLTLAARANPLRIPRHHRIEAAIAAAQAQDFAPFERLNAALSAPFDAREDWADLSLPPIEAGGVRTFCGT